MTSIVVSVTTAATSVTIAAVIGLIVFLVVRELADASGKPSLQLLSRYLTLYAVPLLVSFAFIVIIEIVRVIA
jgi:hypothetical protein